MDIFELDVATIWRQVNIVLALVALFLLVRWFKWRRYFNSQELAFCHGAIFTAVSVIVYSIQLLLNDDSFSASSPLATVALGCFIYGTLKKPDRIEQPLNRGTVDYPHHQMTTPNEVPSKRLDPEPPHFDYPRH